MIRIRVIAAAAAVVCLSAANLSAQSGTAALNGLDPVALCAGEEIAGLPVFNATRGAYRYRFANAENRDAFNADSERYEIQMGGCCARMGPLSGKGSPNRFAVHGGRVYVFASDQCREGFLKDPERCIPKADAPAVGDEAAREAAKPLIKKLVEALGGAERIDGFVSVRFERETKVKDGEKERVDGARETFAATNDFRRDLWWGEAVYSYVLGPKGAFYARGKEDVEPLQQPAIDELRRQATRSPLMMARARKRPDFLAFRVGEGKVGDVAVEKVAVSFDGATTIWGIDPKLGYPLSAEFRGHGPDMRYGAVETRFSDFRKANGALVPFKIEGVYEGKPRAEMTVVWDRIHLDARLSGELFLAP